MKFKNLCIDASGDEVENIRNVLRPGFLLGKVNYNWLSIRT